MMRLIIVFLGSQLSVAAADSTQVLSDPLSLQQVMQMAEQPDYFTLIDAQSKIAQSQSALELAESSLGFSAQLELQAAYVEPPSIAYDQSNNDSTATLYLIKPLYDFGGSGKKVQAASIEQQAWQANMSYVVANRKIEIAKYFFEVILSDLKYAWDNESLAIAYVQHDTVKDRHALLQISDLELLESENRYMDALHARSLSEIEQRHSRATLAEVLNRPTQLPSNLVLPEFDFLQTELPDYALLMDKVLLSNPQIYLAEQQYAAAEQRLEAENKQMSPLLSAELTISEYARTTSSDDMRASLNLTMPLYESSSIKSRISGARANLLSQRAKLLSTKSQIRKQTLNLWQTVVLLQTRQQQLQSKQDLRELELDKSRALYEMEVKTDLGNSMVAISEIRYLRAKNEYELALAWMQLRLLAGEKDIINATL